MNTQAGRDRLHTSLNPLVTDGTLTPYQADRVYRAVGSTEVDSSTPSAVAGWDRPRLFATLMVFAAGLLSSAYVMAASLDAQHRDFTWKTFALMLVSVLVGGGAAAALLLLVQERVWNPWAAGALGALALTGFSVGIVVLWHNDALSYVTGLLMLLGGAAGYWFLKSQLYAVVAVLGGLIVIAQGFSDLLGSGADEGDALSVGIGFLFYGVAVAGAGWLFSCRHLLGVIGLGISVLAMFVVMVLNAVAVAFVAFADTTPTGPQRGGPTLDSLRSDIRVALILGLLVALLAAGAHAYSGLVGFAVVSFVAVATLPVTAVFTMQTDHPLRWAVGFAVVATLGLAAIVGLQLDRRTPPAHHGYGGSPLPPDHSRDPHSDTIAR